MNAKAIRSISSTLSGLLVGLGLCISHPVQAAGEDASGFTILDLVDSGVKGLPGCINYCVVGVCIHLRIRLQSVQIIVSPRIEHNTPEFVVSSFAAGRQQPWMEWREVFGPAQEQASNGILDLVTSAGRVGGYGSYMEEFGTFDQQAPFKEVDIIGHPMSLLPILLANGDISNRMPRSLNESNAIDEMNQANEDPPSPLEEFNDAMDSANEIVDTAGFPAVFLDPALLSVFSYMETANQIRDTVNTVSEAMDMLQQMSDLLDSPPGISGKFKADYWMCPNQVLPFTPYYLSSMDLFGWRLGIPDRLFHAGDIAHAMVPFASHRKVIGTPAGGMPGLGEGTWGGLYPRNGFVRNSHDGKVASVTAQRGLDLLLARRGQDHTGHVTLFNPGFPNRNDLRVVPYVFQSSGIVGGVWQPVFPSPKYQCTTSLYRDKTVGDIANDRSAPRSNKLRYAWAFWRRYNCCMQRRGNLISSTNIPPVCLTGDIVTDPQAGSEEK